MARVTLESRKRNEAYVRQWEIFPALGAAIHTYGNNGVAAVKSEKKKKKSYEQIELTKKVCTRLIGGFFMHWLHLAYLSPTVCQPGVYSFS